MASTLTFLDWIWPLAFTFPFLDGMWPGVSCRSCHWGLKLGGSQRLSHAFTLEAFYTVSPVRNPPYKKALTNKVFAKDLPLVSGVILFASQHWIGLDRPVKLGVGTPRGRPPRQKPTRNSALITAAAITNPLHQPD